MLFGQNHMIYGLGCCGQDHMIYALECAPNNQPHNIGLTVVIFKNLIYYLDQQIDSHI